MELELDGCTFVVGVDRGFVTIDCLDHEWTWKFDEDEVKRLCCALMNAAVDALLEKEGGDGDA